MLSCFRQDSAVSHTSNKPKTEVQVIWTAPQDPPPSVQFLSVSTLQYISLFLTCLLCEELTYVLSEFQSNCASEICIVLGEDSRSCIVSKWRNFSTIVIAADNHSSHASAPPGESCYTTSLLGFL